MVNTSSDNKQSISIMLTGGGARGAYQAGALWRMSELVGVKGDNWQIRHVCGISAGSINAAFFASRYNEMSSMKMLGDLWSSIRSKQVFRSDILSLSKMGSSFLLDAALGPLSSRKLAKSLVDTKPLYDLLNKYIDTDRIGDNLNDQGLHGIAIAAYDYNLDSSVSFIQSAQEMPLWSKSYRRSENVNININHVMASSAIPLIFPPIVHDGRYFADGVLRNTAPLSPLLRFGTDKIFIINVQKEKPPEEMAYPRGQKPSIGTTFGLVLNALFFDNFEMDIERLDYINRSCGDNHKEFRKIPYFMLRPSRSLTGIAKESYKSLPRGIRYLMAGLGESRETLEMASYLLFESEYTSRVVKLGYHDFKAREQEFLEFASS